ncbi:MAG: hypothetical protein WBV69_00950 [Candidatus Sulfotelmatobacter sp.]
MNAVKGWNAMKRITYVGFFGFVLTGIVLLSGSTGAAQSAAQSTTQAPDQTSLGDYARKVHKDPTTKAKAKVFDNDNLPKDDKISVVGEPAAEPAPAADNTSADSSSKAAAPAGGKDAAPASASKPAATPPAATPEDQQAKKQAEWKSWQERLVEQKNAIDLAQRELDVLQREYELRAAVMYADVGNRLRNQTQWDKEDADYKQKIADKQKAVEDAKQKLIDLEEDARKAGVPSAMREP